MRGVGTAGKEGKVKDMKTVIYIMDNNVGGVISKKDSERFRVE